MGKCYHHFDNEIPQSKVMHSTINTNNDSHSKNF